MFDRLELGQPLTTLVSVEDIDVRHRPNEWLVGVPIETVDVSVAPGNWQFRFQNGCRLNVGSWRVISDGVVAFASDDYGQLEVPSEVAEYILGIFDSGKVVSVEIGADTGDIRISLERSVRIEGLVMSARYESWDLHGIDGTQVVAASGGTIHRAGPAASPK